ncbi:unnamed protein product [Knipowitschia caucasica]
MAEFNEVIDELDHFNRWKVDDLKRFCSRRGLPVTTRTAYGNRQKRKEELAALAYAASIQKLPVVLTKEEERDAVKTDYLALLTVGDKQIADPLTATDGWLNEVRGLKLWPPCMSADIAEYLLNRDEKSLLHRLRNDYKEGKAFSYFASQESWIQEVFYRDDADPDLCVLKATCTPSQSIRAVPHKLWVCFQKKTGAICSAYCSCFAGLGATCNHVAALLFKVDYAWQNGLTTGNVLPCTSQPNVWKAPALKNLENVKCQDMLFIKPHFRKPKSTSSAEATKVSRALFSTVRSTNDSESPSLDELTAVFYPAISLAVAFQYALPNVKPTYTPETDVNVAHTVEVELEHSLPLTLPELAKQYNSASEMFQQLPVYSAQEVHALHEATRDQSTSELWFLHRRGRVTASNAHSVLTGHRTGNALVSESLLDTILGEKQLNPDIIQVKYGRENEPAAVDCYVASQKKFHQNMKVEKSGIFILPDACFIAASPDRLVSCDCCGLGILEVKCPYKQAGKSVVEMDLDYLTNGKLNPNHKYFTQVQVQMGVTQRFWCDFVIYLGKGIHIERIQFKEKLWHEAFQASEFYFRRVVAPALVTKT